MAVLEQMCDVLHKASFDEIYGSMVLTEPGDVLDLKKALRKALAFDVIFAQSKAEDRARLYALLQNVDDCEA